MSLELAVSPPQFQELIVNKPLLCGPGPADLWPSVQEALTNPVVTHMCDAQFKLLDDIRAGLKYVFQTRSPLVACISGSGHSGMETVINNLVAPGEKILIASRGIWDERAAIMAKRYGIKTIIIKRAPSEVFTEAEIERALRQHRPTALFITHGDSSTGTVQDCSRLGPICHKYGALFIVDTVVSLGSSPFLMDAWGVDATYSSSQKGLSGPAGISPVAFSARAEKIIQTRKFEPVFYFDVKLLAEQWNCYGDTRVYHHTMSPPLLWAMRASLLELCREGLLASWARHEHATRRLHDGVRALPGVRFFVPEPSHRLVTVTTLVLPEGYDYGKVVNFIREKHNIVIFKGLGPTAGKVLRIGIMGVNANERVSDAVVRAVEDALQKLKTAKL